MENYFKDDKKIVGSCLWGMELGSKGVQKTHFSLHSLCAVLIFTYVCYFH